MGGNALKNTVTRRYEREEFFKTRMEVLGGIVEALRLVTAWPLKAYGDKESFGDLDILIESDHLPPDWCNRIYNTFGATERVKNGNVLSLHYRDLQVDLIATPAALMDTSYNYFNYNDLGNLLGRVAHSMGLKLGHDGLSYSWREDTYNFRTEVICTDWDTILAVLGYDPARYAAGFPTLLSIFEFVASGRFFRPEIYQLENRNHAARVRDQKRKTYMAFLEWVAALPVPEPMAEISRPDAYVVKVGKRFFLPWIFTRLPDFAARYPQVMQEWEDAKEFKRRYNGTLVAGWLGITGPDLGAFMRWMKEHHGDQLQHAVLRINPETVDAWVTHYYGKFTGAPGAKIDGGYRAPEWDAP